MLFAIRNAAGCGNPLVIGCSQALSQATFLGIPYDKNGTGVWDKIANAFVEPFAGPHDFGNNVLGRGYGDDGFTYQNPSFAHELWTGGMNFVNIPLAVPFALSTMINPAMVPFL
ncbi:MAG: hypothetical protein LBP90_03165, partial [Burkholderiales bacterium]|nr:hypothetical protein [Burkholderiales bacterium]